MIYRVKHVTEYLYAETVSTSHHQLHLLPRSAPGQTIHAEALLVDPEAAVRRDRFDWFGNRCTHLAIHERHNRLAVTSAARHRGRGVSAAGRHHQLGTGAGRDPGPRRRRGAFRDGARAAVSARDPSGAAREFAAPSFPRGAPAGRGGARSDAPDPCRVHLRSEGDRRLHVRRRGAEPQARRLPGLRPRSDRLPAIAGPACPLRQRLSGDPSHRRAPAGGRRRLPRLAVGPPPRRAPGWTSTPPTT